MTRPDNRHDEGRAAARRLLMLAHDFPPAASAGAWRPAMLASHLGRFGWVPLVVTVRASSYARTDPGGSVPLAPPGRIVRTRTLLARRVAHRTADTWRSPADAGGLTARAGRALRNALFVPDTQVAWWPFALPAAMRLARREGIDAIYATAPPFSTLLLGLRLKRLLRCPLVADFRDPWTYDMEHLRPWEPPRRVARERAQERRVLEQADAILVTAETLREELRRAHPGVDPSRFHVVTNGYDEEAFRGLERSAASDRFRLVYTGRIGGQWYDPRPLLDVLDRWVTHDPAIAESVEVHVVGPGSSALPIDGRPCRALIRAGRPADRRDALAHQLGADVLLLLVTEPRALRVPGKLFEYLYAGAPVLAIASQGRDTSRILDATGAGETFEPGETEGPVRFLREVHARWRTGGASPAARAACASRDAVTAYDRKRLTERLARLLDGLVEH